ncbi:MAG: RtcB family protein [Phycisphaerae bacterium]|nr:RtcB family protein [Phycisphaerae bacterium]
MFLGPRAKVFDHLVLCSYRIIEHNPTESSINYAPISKTVLWPVPSVALFCAARDFIGCTRPSAYKDVNLVVDIVHNAGLSKKVARCRPLGVIKG